MPSCAGALRVNSFANRGGYAGARSHYQAGGSLAFLNVSGAPSQFFAMFGGAQLLNGVPSPFGILNLDLGQPIAPLLNGLLDAFGEALIPLAVPIGLPPDLTLTLQCAVSTATSGVITNPEQLVF